MYSYRATYSYTHPIATATGFAAGVVQDPLHETRSDSARLTPLAVVMVIGRLSGVSSLHIDLMLSPGEAATVHVSAPHRHYSSPSLDIRRPPALHSESEQAQWRPSFPFQSVGGDKVETTTTTTEHKQRRRRGINQQRRPSWAKAAATWQRERLRIHDHRHVSIITRTAPRWVDGGHM